MSDEPATKPPLRRYARAAAELQLEDRSNATVARQLRIHNCGPAGSASFTRTLDAGTRVQIVEEHPTGLYRILFPGGGDHGTLVDVEDIDPDDDRPPG